MAKKKIKNAKQIKSVATEPSVVALEIIQYTNPGLDREVTIVGKTLGSTGEPATATFLLKQEGRRQEFKVQPAIGQDTNLPESEYFFRDSNGELFITIKEEYKDDYKEVYNK